MTSRQKEVLDYFKNERATTSESARSPDFGNDYVVAMTLARQRVLNLRLDDDGNELFWIRGDGEPATGAMVSAGFVVILNRDITNKKGESVNFFLARTQSYDLKTKSFRAMLRGWLKKLGLSPKDLISLPIERTGYDAKWFSNPDHVVLEE